MTFHNGRSVCKSLGLQVYGGTASGPITKIRACASAMAVPVILGQTELAPVNAGSWATYSPSGIELPDAIIVLPGLPLGL